MLTLRNWQKKNKNEVKKELEKEMNLKLLK